MHAWDENLELLVGGVGQEDLHLSLGMRDGERLSLRGSSPLNCLIQSRCLGTPKLRPSSPNVIYVCALCGKPAS